MDMNARLVGLMFLAAGAVQGQDASNTFNPGSLPSGAIVRISARRPLIHLRRAEVIGCTTNLLTLRHDHENIEVAASNVLDLALLERPKNIASSEPRPSSTEVRVEDQKAPVVEDSGKKGLWERIKSLWQRSSAAKESPKASSTR
jgi:hypothetical protein